MKENVVALVQWFNGGYVPYTPSKEELFNAKFEYLNRTIFRPEPIYKCVINKISYTVYFENIPNELMGCKIILTDSEFEFLKLKLL